MYVLLSRFHSSLLTISVEINRLRCQMTNSNCEREQILMRTHKHTYLYTHTYIYMGIFTVCVAALPTPGPRPLCIQLDKWSECVNTFLGHVETLDGTCGSQKKNPWKGWQKTGKKKEKRKEIKNRNREIWFESFLHPVGGNCSQQLFPQLDEEFENNLRAIIKRRQRVTPPPTLPPHSCP